MIGEPPRDGARGLRDKVARRSTGLKLFLLLSLALLPLALIVMLAAGQSTRDADTQRRQLRTLALDDAARRLGAALTSDIAILQTAAQSARLAGECDRTRALLAAGLGGTDFSLIPADSGNPRCGSSRLDRSEITRSPEIGQVRYVLDASDGHLLIVVGGARAAAVVGYSPGALANAVSPDLRVAERYAITIDVSGAQAALIDELGGAPPAPRQRYAQAVPGASGVSLLLDVETPSLAADQVLLMLLPLLMWLAAAGIGWLVVHRLLLRPLIQLRAIAARYRPGEVVQPMIVLQTPAREIGELADTFSRMTTMVARHEAELAEGLDRQRRLTREVHHRVKNNLQVVASLINIHARGARSDEASEAYASIQRRVDALAVVHRNHFAEIEVNFGVALRPLLGELTANLRATAPPETARMTIQLAVAPVHVSQDVAVPIAFMLTELIEQAMAASTAARILVSVVEEAPLVSRLTVASPALVAGLAQADRDLHGRVVEGLARQLRSTLDRDAAAGRVSLRFASLGHGAIDDDE